MKKMLALLLALVMVLSLAACASSQPAAASTETAETTETTEPAAEESAEAPAESGKTYTVGVCQLLKLKQHQLQLANRPGADERNRLSDCARNGAFAAP